MIDATQQAVASRMGAAPGGGGPQSVTSSFRTGFGMPSLDTTAIVDSAGAANTLANTCTVYDFPGVISRMRIVFGKRNAFGTMIYPTLPVTDDGSTGSGFLKLLNFPKGVITIHKVYPYIPVVLSAASAWTCTTSIMSVGTAAAGTDAVLSTTEANVVPPSTLKLLTYSSNVPVIGSVVTGSLTTLASRTGVFTLSTTEVGPRPLPLILDSTGGTSGLTLATGTVAATAGTLASILTGASILAATQNAHSTEVAYINELIRRTEGLMGLRFDGSTTAVSLYLNFGVNSDPGAAQTISLGALTSGSEALQPPGYIDIDYMNCYGGTTTAVQDVAAPLHGQFGG